MIANDLARALAKVFRFLRFGLRLLGWGSHLVVEWSCQESNPPLYQTLCQ